MDMSRDRIEADQKLWFGKTFPIDNTARPPGDGLAGYESMWVRICTPTPGWEDLHYHDFIKTAARMMCVSWNSTGTDAQRLIDEMPFEEMEDRVVKILTKFFVTPVVESAVFVFEMHGVSRSMTHQIVRHRSMAFHQQSMRVSNCLADPCRFPPGLVPRLQAKQPEHEPLFQCDAAKAVEDFRSEWSAAVEACRKVYARGLQLGLDPEDVRDVLPNGTNQKIFAVMRLRELLAWLNDRTSDITQDEHHWLVSVVCNEIEGMLPKWSGLLRKVCPRWQEHLEFAGVPRGS